MSQAQQAFRFLDPGPLIDGELELALVNCAPANEARNRVPQYDFEMRVPGRGGATVGGINFRAVSTRDLELYGGHIGYGVNAPHRGHRYAARSVRLLFPLARAHGFTTLWITCNPDNAASRRTCEIAGGTLVEVVDLPPDNDMYLEGERQKCRYRFDLLSPLSREKGVRNHFP
jgi:tagatose 1,6-diphosphate aldolase